MSLLAVLLLAGVAYVYGRALEIAPPYLCHDEIAFGSHGHAIATTGHDLNGRFMPLFFHVRDGYWATPVTIYTMALVQQVLPLSEWAIRLPTVFVGVLNVALLYLIARRIFPGAWLPALAALLLAATPAHYIHSRLAVDHIYVLPFVLGWLLCLQHALPSGRPALLFAAGLLLGVGFFSYLAAVILTPICLGITLVAVALTHGWSPKLHAAAILGFLLPVSLLVPWLVTHPNQFADQILMYKVYDSTRLSVAQGTSEVFSWAGLTSRINVYYGYYNPSFLFFSGASSLINGTSQVGVFLLPMAVLLPAGLHHIVTRQLTPFNLVILLGFAAAPLPSVVVNEAAINRGLVLLPCAALIATFGVASLLGAVRQRWRSVGAVALAAALAWQFGVFQVDYFGAYRERAGYWFEGNRRGAIEEVMARASTRAVPAIYLSTDIDWIDWYWRFYLTKGGRTDLLGPTVYFDPRAVDLQSVPAGSILLTRTDVSSHPAFRSGEARRHVTVIPEVGGAAPSFEVADR